MNHIARLQRDLDEANGRLREADRKLIDLEIYLLSMKFQAEDADWVGVRTDMIPRLTEIRAITGVN